MHHRDPFDRLLVAQAKNEDLEIISTDKILSFKPTGEIYDTIRPNFNPNGDKSMTRVLTIANFNA
jgi:hypothetical protein